MAYAYVCAIGEKITPVTPVSVKSGRKATPRMIVEKTIGRPTSPAAARTRSSRVPSSVAAEVPDARLDHDDRRLDDDSEVDGPERDEVGRRAPDRHAEQRREQGQRDVERREQRRPPVPEKEEEHGRHEHHPEHQVVQDGVRRRLDQVRAVVVGRDVHPGRKQVVPPDLGDLGAHALERAPRVAADLHEHDPLDDVVVAVVAHDAEPRRVADRHVRDVADANRRSALGRDDDVADVVEAADQADAAHVEGLFADVQDVGPDVLVRRRERREQRRERQTVAAQPVRVDVHLVLLDEAAEAGDVDDAVDLLELPLQDPVLRGLALERASTRGP